MKREETKSSMISQYSKNHNMSTSASQLHTLSTINESSYKSSTEAAMKQKLNESNILNTSHNTFGLNKSSMITDY